MANIHISDLPQQHTNISQEQLININGGAIALSSFLNQANKSKKTEKSAIPQSNELVLMLLQL